MTRLTIIQRLSSGTVEAVIVEGSRGNGAITYGVCFRRFQYVSAPIGHPFFTCDELQNIAGLAREAHRLVCEREKRGAA